MALHDDCLERGVAARLDPARAQEGAARIVGLGQPVDHGVRIGLRENGGLRVHASLSGAATGGAGGPKSLR